MFTTEGIKRSAKSANEFGILLEKELNGKVKESAITNNIDLKFFI